MTVRTVVTASVVAAWLATAPAAEPKPGVAALEDRLKSGLRVRTPRDIAYVEAVAALVRRGRLPAQIVDSSYLWAVNRGREHPFPAFRQSLQAQADQLGLRLPGAASAAR